MWLLLLLLPALISAQDLPKLQQEMVGTKLHDMVFTDYILNKPADTNFIKKFKVLEFWVTWCRPCLAAVPHLNKLQKKFKEDNIVFFSVTYEDPSKTNATMDRVRFETIVVSDQTKTIHRDLRIEYKGQMWLPRTVLLDPENRIVWFGSPKDLTVKLLERFLAGSVKNE